MFEMQSVLSGALDIGEAMLSAGAEVYRVEDTISRICLSYGVERADVFAIPNSIVATVYGKSGESCTQTRRVRSSETNFSRVDKLNQLSRDVCASTPEPDELSTKVDEIKRNTSDRKLLMLAAYILSTSAFCIFFGGTAGDAVASGLGGLIIYLMGMLKTNKRPKSVVDNVIPSAVAAALAYLCVKIGMARNVDLIVIGEIMLLIPGMELTNGMRDFLAGDTVAGLSHICKAICGAISIAAGSAAMLRLLGGLFG